MNAQVLTIGLEGIIVMWSGSITSIPTGWALCDGSNGTPDLRDRFILSVGASEEPGATGGSSTYTHAGSAVSNHGDHDHEYTEIVSHTHPVTDPGHTHSEGYRNTGTAGTLGVQGASTANNASIANGCLSAVTGISTGNPVGGVVSGTTAGSNQTLSHSVTQSDSHSDVKPPYYKLAFIMKV